ncbi:ribonuclease H-like protein [Coprinopsis marcescibilis]|uniref:RNA exonuclease 4 n=1 Tax=Coprinopsis marcescibilis TaxID=230819 RepID=A0A5C3KL24_COPMA|nr:ribonuclease H-like protein [Coprinopsis marcescibilis]
MPPSSQAPAQAGPSSNWAKLQEKLKKARSDSASSSNPGWKHTAGWNRKRKRTDRDRGDREDEHEHDYRRASSPAHSVSSTTASTSYAAKSSYNTPAVSFTPTSTSHENVGALQAMVFGHVELSEKHQLPGRYLALDCEMVGVGLEGAESSLARVSVVNFYGHTILDAFVKQRERVVDYRTQFSGVRERDMINAIPFLEVQKQVAELLKERILVGHAVHHDLKALLLSHPYPQTRDTQVLAYRSKHTKTRRIALRNLVKQDIGIAIQDGEHSSVTDARATMAVYRLHKKEWDKLFSSFQLAAGGYTGAVVSEEPGEVSVKKKQKRRAGGGEDGDEDGESSADEGGGAAKAISPSASASASTPKTKTKNTGQEIAQRKGVSSGLSTVVRHQGGNKEVVRGAGGGSRGARREGAGGNARQEGKAEWWKELPGSARAASMKAKVSVKFRS